MDESQIAVQTHTNTRVVSSPTGILSAGQRPLTGSPTRSHLTRSVAADTIHPVATRAANSCGDGAQQKWTEVTEKVADVLTVDVRQRHQVLCTELGAAVWDDEFALVLAWVSTALPQYMHLQTTGASRVRFRQAGHHQPVVGDSGKKERGREKREKMQL